MRGAIERMLVAGLTVRITDFANKSCFLHQFKGPINGAPADPRSAACKLSHKIVGAEVAAHFADAKEYDVSRRGDAAVRTSQERHELRPGGLRSQEHCPRRRHSRCDFAAEDACGAFSLLPLFLPLFNVLIATEYKDRKVRRTERLPCESGGWTMR